MEPVFVGIHDFLNPPPWIHMIDYICTLKGGKIVVNDRSCNSLNYHIYTVLYLKFERDVCIITIYICTRSSAYSGPSF